MRLDPFYLIVDSTDWIARLVPLGVKLVQPRIKDRSEEELRPRSDAQWRFGAARTNVSWLSTTTGGWRSRKSAI